MTFEAKPTEHNAAFPSTSLSFPALPSHKRDSYLNRSVGLSTSFKAHQIVSTYLPKPNKLSQQDAVGENETNFQLGSFWIQVNMSLS